MLLHTALGYIGPGSHWHHDIMAVLQLAAVPKTAPVISPMAGVLERENKMYIMPKAKLERIRIGGIKVLQACW